MPVNEPSLATPSPRSVSGETHWEPGIPHLPGNNESFAIPWTVACQAPLFMGFSKEEYWNGLPCPPLRDLPNPRTEPVSPVLQEDSLPTEPTGKPRSQCALPKLLTYRTGEPKEMVISCF